MGLTMRRHRLMSLVMAFLMAASSAVTPAMAQMAFSVKPTSGTILSVDTKNMPRGAQMLVLYTPDYAETTRTNPYGVEVVAVRKKGSRSDYTVTKITSTFECQKEKDLSKCGNAAIPENGVVLSAMGDKRQALLDTLKVGDTFTLEEKWFQEKTLALNIMNPTAQTNPMGSAFPGYRAGNQLVMYDSQYGQPTTGTNEFGFEVTVVGGRVVAQEGADSTIPSDGYVLSGHGRARDWLIANAPIGAKISLNPMTKTVTSAIDEQTYREQFARQWNKSEERLGFFMGRQMARALKEVDDLAAAGKQEDAARLASDRLEELNKTLWKNYEAFPASAIRAAWHRPVEKSPEEIGRTLDSLKKAGLNTVFLETFFHGYTIFPSQTYTAYGLSGNQNPGFTGFDPLKTWLEEAHQRNMKVHIWFQTFYAGNKVAYGVGPILEKHPEWANIQYSALSSTTLQPSTLESGAFFLDPANPEVRKFVLALIDEIATRYPVDGIQLDYIRYPASFPPDRFSYHKTTWGYTPVARQQFQQMTGMDPALLDPKNPEQAELWRQWQAFKTEQVSSFVQTASRLIKTRKPSIQVSAAIFPAPEDSVLRKHQEWTRWVANGWVDFLAPMTLTSAIKVVEDDTRRVAGASQMKIPVISGIFGPFNNNSAEHVLEQIDAARRAGAQGFSIFDTAHLTGRMMQALQASQAKPAESSTKR
jgi:uncharacterized lipoprotein YddW (UPF0748 family)